MITMLKSMRVFIMSVWFWCRCRLIVIDWQLGDWQYHTKKKIIWTTHQTWNTTPCVSYSEQAIADLRSSYCSFLHFKFVLFDKYMTMLKFSFELYICSVRSSSHLFCFLLLFLWSSGKSQMKYFARANNNICTILYQYPMKSLNKNCF